MNSNNGHRRSLLSFSTALSLSLFSLMLPGQAAQEVAFVSGAFRRSISVADLEYLAKTGKAKGLMKDVLKFSQQEPEAISNLLKQKLDVPLVLTSRLMNTRIGNVIIERIAKIIYPIKVPNQSVSVPAIKSAVIKGLSVGEDGIDMIDFLKAYPSDVMAVNLPALFGVMEKAESVAGLVKFFSDSPLENLKGAKR